MTRSSQSCSLLRAALATAFIAMGSLAVAQPGDNPLPSWNDGQAREAIVAFVERVTKEGGPDLVPPAERIAVFDNDGTLWCEQPLYFQGLYAFDRVKAIAPGHPEWKDEEPFKSILAGDKAGVAAAGEKGLLQVLTATHAGMTTDESGAAVKDWFRTARHPKFNRPYNQLTYRPMVELLGYLRANGFKTFIVSGGGIEFMRMFAEETYGIPTEQIVGSSGKLKYELRGDEPVLLKLPEVQFIDDGPGKPAGIENHIGRRPVMAFGNSDGDYEMLRWTTAGDGPRFGLIVHHDDADREYAYDRNSHVGKLAKALEEAPTRGWTVAFLTGQHGIRTGLTKVGFPGAPMGVSQLDPSIGGLLRSLGYATGQFGKNHVGDRNETLPTVNGFDEFFGNLYHLNAEEEPELPDYPKDPAFAAKWGPRGVLKCKATDTDDPAEDPRFGKIGKQTIEDTGALKKERMETIDDETSAAAIDYIKRQHAAGKPFFCWWNGTRMHLRTHVKAENRGKYQHGDSEYIDGMIEHDAHVGLLLKALDHLGIADDTIVVYSTDNGPHMNTWPDGAMTPLRSEKNTNWEGAFRVPCLVRWPGHIKPGTITNELMSHNDWIPTLCAIAGEPDIVGKCLKGYQADGRTYKVHLDGYDQSKFLTSVEGTVGRNNGVRSARERFYYTDDDALLVAMRQGDYKMSFAEQRMPGTMAVWGEPFTKLRMTKLYNLMQDPFERADITSNTYWDWIMNHVPQVYQGMEGVTDFIGTFKEYPPRSVPPSFNPANMLEDTLRDIKAKQKLERAFPMLAPPAQ